MESGRINISSAFKSRTQGQFHLAKPLCEMCKSLCDIFSSKSSLKVAQPADIKIRPSCKSLAMQSFCEFDSTPERPSIGFLALLQAQLKYYYEKFQSAKGKMDHLQEKFGFKESHLEDFQKFALRKQFKSIACDATPTSSGNSSTSHHGRCDSKCMTPKKRPRVLLSPFSKWPYRCSSKCCISKVVTKSGYKELKRILNSIETHLCGQSCAFSHTDTSSQQSTSPESKLSSGVKVVTSASSDASDTKLM